MIDSEGIGNSGDSVNSGNSVIPGNSRIPGIINKSEFTNTSINIDTKILTDGCKKTGIVLSDTQVEQFVRYYQLLLEKNKVMNLTAITEWEEVETKHFLDSLLIKQVPDLKLGSESLKVLDLGTGAGFPGIPLKIVFPDLEITLVDSLKKRLHFLDEVICELGLEKIRTVHGRAEDIGRNPDYREKYDLVVSRAVANLSSLSEYCLPLVKKGGKFISYKSTDIDIEYQKAGKAFNILGGKADPVIEIPLPYTDMIRSFVVVKKVVPTPPFYPRKAGTPAKKPL